MDFIVRASLGMIKNLQSYPRRDGFSSRKMKAVSEGQKVDISNGARLKVTKFTPASLPELLYSPHFLRSRSHIYGPVQALKHFHWEVESKGSVKTRNPARRAGDPRRS